MQNVQVSQESTACESLEFYESLLEKAFDVYRDILPFPPRSTDLSAMKIWLAAQKFVSGGQIVRTTPRPRDGAIGVAFDALDLLAKSWPQIRTGQVNGEVIYARDEGLWERLMCEPPMGKYAELAATLVNRYVKPMDLIIELGSGVGNASRLLQLPSGVSYIRTDVNPFLAPVTPLPQALTGKFQRYDFDRPSGFRSVDIVFAVNALHCARSPRESLRYIHSMLKDNGILILSEGAPMPTPEHPWALDALFCQFTGWWDRTGFRPRSDWMKDLEAVHFRNIAFGRLFAGEFDLGGTILARR